MTGIEASDIDSIRANDGGSRRLSVSISDFKEAIGIEGEDTKSLRRQLTDATSFTWYLFVHDSSLTYNDLKNEIVTAVANGEFDAAMHSYATTNGATGMTTATSSSVTVTDPSNDDSNSSNNGNKLSLGALIGIIVGGTVFVMVLVGLCVYVFFSGSLMQVQYSNPGNGDPAVGDPAL
jgi:hypothetical protein